MSFAFPRASNKPLLVWDQASSTTARGEIQLALREGKSIPRDAAVGPDGTDTLDPQLALEGAQKTFGGHKGTCIALMVELLSAVVTGSALGFELKDESESIPTSNGELIIAIDPSKASGIEKSIIFDRAEALFEEILADEGTRLPGGRRASARVETTRDGVEISHVVLDEIIAIVADAQGGDQKAANEILKLLNAAG
mmetsp:Transcript_21499/g.38133  ORF Transcript_21499/g.38133 Transcript_21499/m.38133 type:complete len:197 (+) Transcript_21499:221-811(+)